MRVIIYVVERGMIEQLHNAFREMSKEEGSLNAESFFALFERSFPKLTSEEIKYYWNVIFSFIFHSLCSSIGI